jgi:hypothetical protein
MGPKLDADLHMGALAEPQSNTRRIIVRSRSPPMAMMPATAARSRAIARPYDMKPRPTAYAASRRRRYSPLKPRMAPSCCGGRAARGFRRLRGRKSAIRRFPSAESPDHIPRMLELCPERFGGERRHIWRGRVGSRSAHLKGTFLKGAFASSCAVGACVAESPCFVSLFCRCAL